MQSDKYKLLKTLLLTVYDCMMLAYGLAYYFLRRNKPLLLRTPANSHLSMIRLFCLTKGWSNDFLSKCVSLFDKPLPLPHHTGVLGELSSHQISTITKSLDQDGYYIFDNRLPPETVKRLYQFACEQECMPRPLDGESTPPTKTRYDRNNLKSTVYDLPSASCLSNPDVQNLLTDHSIISIAQSYLRTSPKAEPIAFWWSTPFGGVAQSNAAQLYHFDLDRFKWIKFFIFLTDVTLETGPHVFIRQSHQTGKIPYELLKAGYVRHEDKDVTKFYPSDDIKTFTVPAGTIVAEDTRGLHKGTSLLNGERLVLELQFSNCLFGAVSTCIQDANIKQTHLLDFAQKYPKIFKLYPV